MSVCGPASMTMQTGIVLDALLTKLIRRAHEERMTGRVAHGRPFIFVFFDFARQRYVRRYAVFHLRDDEEPVSARRARAGGVRGEGGLPS
jgi:hypothetical protein